MFWNKFLSMAVIASSALCFSCSYDDDDVWNAINDQEERIAALERWQETTNSNIAALQAIVNGNDFIKSVTPVTENGQTIGYTISFLRQGDMTIYHGTKGNKGDQGDKGDKGDKGDAGVTPVISVTAGEDGRWYWTLNGELLKDANDNPVCASGKDGQDGENGANGTAAPTPQLKTGSELGSGYVSDAVYLSIDGGATWTRVSGKDGQDGADGADGADGSNGSNGDNVFNPYNPIVDNGESWQFNLANGNVINVPKYRILQLKWKYGTYSSTYNNITDGECEVDAGKEIVLHYTLLDDDNQTISWAAFDDDNKKITIKEYENSLFIPSITIGHSITIIFSVTYKDNQTIFFKAKFKAKLSSEDDVVIYATENKELSMALAEVLGLTLETDGNLRIPIDVATSVRRLILEKKGLKSLVGIEKFNNLGVLNCSDNSITELISEELPKSLCSLFVSNNQISNLDLSGLDNLVTLYCANNPIKDMNLDGLTALEDLICDNVFTQHNTRTYLSNERKLDLTCLINLKSLSCNNNNLTELIVTNCSLLERLRCSGNKLKTVDLSSNPKLRYFEAWDNSIETIDLTKNPLLEHLDVAYGNLTSIDLSKNKELCSLAINGHKLKILNLTCNEKLSYINCSDNEIKVLSVNHLNLQSLYCHGNNISILDISKQENLQYLYCGNQNNDKEMILVVNDNQMSLWENNWKNNWLNRNVKISDTMMSNSNGGGSHFGNGGVY